MPSLPSLIPDVEVLLSLAPEEVAFSLLQVTKSHGQHGKFHLSHIISNEHLFGYMQHNAVAYPMQKQAEVWRAVGEAWQWLQVNGLIMPAPDDNNGWMVLTRRGEDILKHPENFRAYQSASAFSKALLNDRIRETVWLELARGDYDAAVFKAFKAVEEAVRIAAKYSDSEFGVSMMRDAFGALGPLAVGNTKGEKVAMMDLFAGATGVFKNPQSHRTVGIRDPLTAQKMVVIASYLLDVVEAAEVQ